MLKNKKEEKKEEKEKNDMLLLKNCHIYEENNSNFQENIVPFVFIISGLF